MALTITGRLICGTDTPHVAEPLADESGLCRVSWLPGRELTQSQAVSAMLIAQAAGRGLTGREDRRWPHVEGWAGELRLSGPRCARPGVGAAAGGGSGMRCNLRRPAARRAARQLDLLHEIGHHAEYLADVLPASQSAAGEAPGRELRLRPRGRQQGQESFSAYDAGVTDARSGLRHRWGAAQARAYKAERAAGCLPGDPPAPVNAARFFEPDSFTAARGRRAARLSERGGERVPSLPGRDHADLEAG